MYRIIKLIHKFLSRHHIVCEGVYGPCFHKGHMRRQNTAYVNDVFNWVFVCDKCFEEIEEHWREQWEEYDAGRL